MVPPSPFLDRRRGAGGIPARRSNGFARASPCHWTWNIRADGSYKSLRQRHRPRNRGGKGIPLAHSGSRSRRNFILSSSRLSNRNSSAAYRYTHADYTNGITKGLRLVLASIHTHMDDARGGWNNRHVPPRLFRHLLHSLIRFAAFPRECTYVKSARRNANGRECTGVSSRSRATQKTELIIERSCIQNKKAHKCVNGIVSFWFWILSCRYTRGTANPAVSFKTRSFYLSYKNRFYYKRAHLFDCHYSRVESFNYSPAHLRILR